MESTSLIAIILFRKHAYLNILNILPPKKKKKKMKIFR